MTRYIIGVDFDNTLVSYDNVMHERAVEFGLIQPHVKKSKKDIRDTIRQLPEGELGWQKLQAFVYGRGMEDAVLIDGVSNFFTACKNAEVPLYIVSHKTDGIPGENRDSRFRDAAYAWMEKKGFFDRERLGLFPHHVYFASTRQEKIERIKELGCTHFIDDLEETFLEKSFPDFVEKIFYSPHHHPSTLPDVRMFTSWRQIHDYFFGRKK